MNKLMMVVIAAFVAGVCVAEEPEMKRGERRGNRPQMGERQRMPGMGMRAGEGIQDPIVFAVMNPRVAEKIGLSDEQKTKLKDLRGGDRELNEKIRKGMEKQAELLKAETIDEAAVMAAIDEVFEARKAVAKAQTKRLIAIRSILTSEQIAKATEAMKEMRGPRGGEGRGPRAPHNGPKGE